MMDLETCQYIDLPSVGVIDLEAPQHPEKEYGAAVGWRSNEPTIMETITSISKALQEYKHAGGFAPAAADGIKDAALAVLAARVEPTEDSTAPPHVDEGREASPPGPVEARVRKTGGNRSGSTGSRWNRSGSVHEPVRFPPQNRAYEFTSAVNRPV
jgi:hypothetical protein